MPTITIVGLVGLVALVKTIIDFLRQLSGLPATKSAVVTMTCALGAGVGATFLYGASQFGNTVVVNHLAASDMDGPTKLLVGLAVGSLAATTTDFIKARDNTDTQVKPPLLGPPGPTD